MSLLRSTITTMDLRRVRVQTSLDGGSDSEDDMARLRPVAMAKALKTLSDEVYLSHDDPFIDFSSAGLYLVGLQTTVATVACSATSAILHAADNAERRLAPYIQGLAKLFSQEAPMVTRTILEKIRTKVGKIPLSVRPLILGNQGNQNRGRPGWHQA